MSINISCLAPEARQSLKYLGHMLLTKGHEVDTGHWQSLKDVPHTKSIELTNVHITFEHVPSTVRDLQFYFEPNLPWAEDHFEERVSGLPLNPGEQYMNWPWYAGGVEGHKGDGQFSHTYMERFWPKKANNGSRTHSGIRYDYGDLDDLVQLLVREPYTRQAYLPMWFPEDTGAHQRQRVPCTLGYHFMLREGKLNIVYPMRSCDFLRYLRDDLYMAARLGLWIIEQCEKKDLFLRGAGVTDFRWPEGVTLGELNFFTSSLHIFEGDLPKMRREYGSSRF
jgi:thymidylate synthase